MAAPMAWPYVFLFMAIIALHLTSTCLGHIFHLSIRNNSRSFIPIDSFGFTSRGRIDMQGSHVSWWTGGDDAEPAAMGFLFMTQDELLLQRDLVNFPAPAHCILHTHFIPPLLTFKDLNGLMEFRRNLSAPDANWFTLIFANCNSRVQVSMDLTGSFYNLEGKDATKDYLSDGLTQLPALYTSFSVSYIAIFVAWMYVCMWKQKQTTHCVHILMGLLVLFKALYLWLDAGDQEYIKQTGVVRSGGVMIYTFSLVKGVMLIIVITLVGAGWFMLKPHLESKEKWVLMVVILLQVLASIVQVLIGERGLFFQAWLAWDQLMVFIDCMGYMALLFPILQSIKRLRHANQSNGKVATSLVKLSLFRHYLLVLLFYVYFTRVVVVVFANVASYHYIWVSMLASETATLAFSIFTGYKFRPTLCNPYFILDEEKEHIVEDLTDDEFEL